MNVTTHLWVIFNLILLNSNVVNFYCYVVFQYPTFLYVIVMEQTWNIEPYFNISECCPTSESLYNKFIFVSFIHLLIIFIAVMIFEEMF